MPPPHARTRVVRLLRARARRLLRRLDRQTPDWMQWLTPYGTSLALHALFVLAFGIILYAQSHAAAPVPPEIHADFAGQLTDDLTSLGDADRAGDPFSRNDTDEPPSITLNPALADASSTNTPELPDRFLLGAELRLNPTDPGPPGQRGGKASAPGAKGARSGSGGDGDGGGEAMSPGLIAPFSGRQGESKARLIRREGGTHESERAVERGIDWLARHQRRDGSWSLDTAGECEGNGCPERPYGVSDMAATGLALLPMMGAGHVHTEKSRYQEAVAKGLHWIMKHQKRGGELFTGGGDHTGLYTHAIATMALCEAYGMTKDPDLLPTARRALTYIYQSQSKADGGWRYFPGQEGDTSVVGWQVFAMRSGRMAGIGIPTSTINRTKLYLKAAATDQSEMFYGYKPGWAASPSMTAEGLLCRQILGWPRDKPALVKGVAGVAAHLESDTARNTYYWYYATQLLHNQRGEEWPRWNRRIRDGLVSTQILGVGCDLGSWDPSYPQPDVWLQRGGRLSMTSLSLLTLEVYYRYLPMYRVPGDELEEAPESIASPANEKPAK